MAKQARITYSAEAKADLIKKYKPTYLASSRAKINNEKEFDALDAKKQWNIIYVNYIVKKEKSKSTTVKAVDAPFTYNTVRAAINTLKKSVDVMNKEQIAKMFTDLEELSKLAETREERMKAAELEKLAKQKQVLLDEIKEIEELEKTLTE